jgi:hypothetical protein
MPLFGEHNRQIRKETEEAAKKSNLTAVEALTQSLTSAPMHPTAISSAAQREPRPERCAK